MYATPLHCRMCCIQLSTLTLTPVFYLLLRQASISYIEVLQLIDTKAYSNGTRAYHINMLNIIMSYNK